MEGYIYIFYMIITWATAMIFMNFMPVGFAKKLLVIIAFTLLTMVFEYFSEYHDMSQHLGKYSEIHDAIQDIISLILVVWFSEGLFGKRIHIN